MQEQGKPTPLDEEPAFNTDDYESIWLITVYLELSKSRPVSEFMSPIPLNDVISYIRLFYGDFELDLRIKMVTDLDVRFINYINHKKDQENKKKLKSNKGN